MTAPPAQRRPLPAPVAAAFDLLCSRRVYGANLLRLAQDLAAALAPVMAESADGEVATLRWELEQLRTVTQVDRCNQAMVDAAEQVEHDNVALRGELEAARARAASAAVDADGLQMALLAVVDAADAGGGAWMTRWRTPGSCWLTWRGAGRGDR